MKKYLPFATAAAAYSYSHALAVQHGHDPDSKDVFYPVFPAPLDEHENDVGGYLEVDESEIDYLTEEQKSLLIDESEVEPGDTFPANTLVRKGGGPAVAGTPAPVSDEQKPEEETKTVEQPQA